jgi:hypothetical protein
MYVCRIPFYVYIWRRRFASTAAWRSLTSFHLERGHLINRCAAWLTKEISFQAETGRRWVSIMQLIAFSNIYINVMRWALKLPLPPPPTLPLMALLVFFALSLSPFFFIFNFNFTFHLLIIFFFYLALLLPISKVAVMWSELMFRIREVPVSISVSIVHLLTELLCRFLASLDISRNVAWIWAIITSFPTVSNSLFTTPYSSHSKPHNRNYWA